MPKVAFKQADVTRLVRGAIAGGWPAGTFGLQLVDGKPTLFPVDGPMKPAQVAPRAADSEADLDAELEAWRAEAWRGLT